MINSINNNNNNNRVYFVKNYREVVKNINKISGHHISHMVKRSRLITLYIKNSRY